MKQLRIYTILLAFVFGFSTLNGQIQKKKPQNLPFADQKIWHLGFYLGMHAQDLSMTQTGFKSPNGEVWFSEIPSYNPGFTVGFIVDRYLSQYFNLRFTPSLFFGDKEFVFREQDSGIEYKKSLSSNTVSLPFSIKFNANRIQNARPYVTAGAYTSFNINDKKGEALRFKRLDYGLEFALGCNIYLPIFKLCPEIKFTLGLADVIDNTISDIDDEQILKYRQSVKSGKTRMISLIFNFE